MASQALPSPVTSWNLAFRDALAGCHHRSVTGQGPAQEVIATPRSPGAESRSAESQASEGRSAESRSAESRAAENRSAENRSAEGRSAENRSAGDRRAESRAGGAETIARPVMVTAAPESSVTLTGTGTGQTVAGAGAGSRPGHGRPGGYRGPAASPNGTRVTCSPGPRPPASTGRVTAP